MADCRSSHVADANVWIDLLEGGLIEALAHLSFDCVIPDVVLHELSETTRQRLQTYGIAEQELSPAQIQEVLDLAARYPRPSRTDLFALVLARSLGTILLTGDRQLRAAAAAEGVEVHGTLWLLDQMVTEGVIPTREAAVALEQMRAGDRRLPENEVAERLQRWRG